MIARYLALLATATGLSGCTAVDPSASGSGWYLGLVHVARKPQPGPPKFAIEEVQSLGLRVDDSTAGVSLGYRAGRHYEIPRDCRVLVLVPDATAVPAVLQHIKNMEGLCVAGTP